MCMPMDGYNSVIINDLDAAAIVFPFHSLLLSSFLFYPKAISSKINESQCKRANRLLWLRHQ